MTCDAFIPLIGLRPDDLAPQERQALTAHLAVCTACAGRATGAAKLNMSMREAGRVLEAWPEAPASHRVPIQERRTPWLPAAAAAAILAVFAWRALGPGTPADPTPERPQQPVGTPGAMPAGPWEGGWTAEADLERPIGANALIALRKGSLLEMREGVMTLRQGCLHAESFGEPLRFQAGGAAFVMSDAEISLAATPGPEALTWIQSAHADDTEVLTGRIWRGQVRIHTADRDTTLRVGDFRIIGGRVEAMPADDRSLWRGPDGWTGLSHEPLRLENETRIFLNDPPAAYALDALVRRRTPLAELGLRFEISGRCFETPAGALLAASEAWTRVRLRVESGHVQATVAGKPLIDAAPGALWRSASEVPGRGAGLRVWGGEIEVSRVRWRLEPHASP